MLHTHIPANTEQMAIKAKAENFLVEVEIATSGFLTGKRATFNFDHIRLVNQLMLSGLYDSQLGTVEMSGYK